MTLACRQATNEAVNQPANRLMRAASGGITKQGVVYVAIGCGLVLIDSGVFVGLTHAAVPAALANVLGRVAGALAGFWANGNITFRRGRATKLGRAQFFRFVAQWCTLTFLSTVAITELDYRASLDIAWVAKPLVEAGLACISFFISRYWVYK